MNNSELFVLLIHIFLGDGGVGGEREEEEMGSKTGNQTVN